MANYPVRYPPNPCFCGHGLYAHQIQAGKCIECITAGSPDAHAFSPEGYVYDTPKTLSGNP